MFKSFVVIFLVILFPVLVFAQEIKPEDAFSSAETAYHQGFYGVSLDLFKRFIRDYPRNRLTYEAKLYVGQCQFQKNNFIKAREIFIDLENSFIPFAIEDRLLFWLGQVYLKAEDFQRASEYLRELINTYSDSQLLFLAKMQLGKILLQDAKYKEAEDMFVSLADSRDMAIKEEALFQKGQVFYKIKDYKAVLKNYRLFCEVFLDSQKLGEAYFYMGEASFYLEDFPKAIEHYSQALESSNDDSIKVMCLEGIGWSYLREDKLKLAKETLLKIDKFPKRNFNNENILYAKAILYSRLNNHGKAVFYYDKLIDTNLQGDMIIHALFGKAEALMSLLRFKEAKKLYAKVIKVSRIDNTNLKETIAKAHYNLGYIFLKEGKSEEALEEFRQAVSLSSNKDVRVSALTQMGDAYQQTQEFQKAIGAYSQILKDYVIDTHNDYVQYQLGRAFISADQIDSAISSFITFNKNFNQSSFLDDANYYLGFAYFKDGQYILAGRQLKNFLDVFLDSEYRGKAAYLLATSFYNRGEYKEAIDSFNKISEEFSRNKDLVQKAKYEIANALYQMGEGDSAVEKFRGFISIYPRSPLTPGVIFWLGQYHYQNREFKLARKNFENLIRRHPRHALAQEARYQVGLTLLTEGEHDKAIRTFKRLIDICEDQAIKAKTMLAMGDLLLEQDKQQQAIQMYNELTQLVSSNSIVLSKFGKVVKSQDSIVLDGKSSDNLNSGDSVENFVKLAFIRLGDLYESNNRFSEAIYAYKQALEYPLVGSNAYIQFKIAECLEQDYNLVASLDAYSNILSVNEQDNIWVVKGLLRSANIYENRDDWQEAVKMYEKILGYDIAEAKYAKERIELIRK